MSDELIPPEPSLELAEALEQLRKKREPWYLDRWLIATVAAIGGAVFMYIARQPEVDHYRNARPNDLPTNNIPLSQPDRVAATGPTPSVIVGPPAPKAGSPAKDPQKEGSKVESKAGQAPASMANSGTAPLNPAMGPLGGNIDIAGTGALPPVLGGASGPTAASTVEPISGLTISGTGSGDCGSVLAGIAKKFGGGLKKYEEYTGRDKSTGGYIVWVPDKNSRAFLDKLKSASGIDISDEQEGSAATRSQVMTENLRTILARLTKQRADLLAKYFEDAPAVKDIDGQIAEVNKSISSMRAPGAGYAVAKIETG